MEMDFKQFETAPPGPPTMLDWHGLAVRLAATRATRQLAVGDGRRGLGSAGMAATGSFAPRLAKEIAAFGQVANAAAPAVIGAVGDPESDPSHPVNPKTKADGKPPCWIEGDIAGVNKTGLRGLL